MTTTDVEAQELTDPELISRVRDGDVAAYGTLFSRHVDAATKLARVLVGGPDADDLVSEAFVKVLNVLLGGGGPDVAFRAYLLTAVRRLHVDKIRSNQKLTTTGDMTPYDPGVPFTDTAIAGFEGGAAAKAFASLPERWQLVLWHLEVENQKPADIAPLLGMSANSVSALAYRAREGLRQAFLNMHSGDLVSEDCRETHDLLGGYVRGALSKRDAGKVEEHLDHCRPCTAVYLELAEVNSSLAAVLGPALLGAAALGYLGGAGAAAGAGAGALALVGRAKDAALGNLPATAAGVAAVGIVGVTAIAIGFRGPSDQHAAADPPLPSAPSSSTAPGTATTTNQPDSAAKAKAIAIAKAKDRAAKARAESARASTSTTDPSTSDSTSTTSGAPLGATTGDALTGTSTTTDQPKKKKKKHHGTHGRDPAEPTPGQHQAASDHAHRPDGSHRPDRPDRSHGPDRPHGPAQRRRVGQGLCRRGRPMDCRQNLGRAESPTDRSRA